MQGAIWAQEAGSGFELRARSALRLLLRLLEKSPEMAGDFTGGFRSVLYPTWKLSTHWTGVRRGPSLSRPYFYEQFHDAGPTA